MPLAKRRVFLHVLMRAHRMQAARRYECEMQTHCMHSQPLAKCSGGLLETYLPQSLVYQATQLDHANVTSSLGMSKALWL